ncbi:16S rRNA (uracil(1498)-N(3))-methyltransferase [Alkalihalobacterium elongatum]|uniref:16S rRNA (uracil(1498)-N(3))-methyltransferase n=1 Tax=Alkalihalobacterium elongatum TaxID=2675466 RepID=UPI001C1FD530|nr:16S rRNA (uracil(1498)-N(3))-methyltransferase [Alkalihalobacterium elongatum]
MQRYFVAKEQMNDHMVLIHGEDVKHITRVMRMSEGDQIICSNNLDRVCLCEIDRFEDDQVVALIVEDLPNESELPVNITIAQALPKGDKLDYVIQKGTELGAAQFIPVQGERSIVKWDGKKAGKRIERLSKIAKEAAEQSHRSRIPEIESLHTLEQLIVRKSEFNHLLFAYEEEGKMGNHKQLADTFTQAREGDSLLFIVGPEGGFSESEAVKLKDAGFIPTSLGPRILRAETAPLYILSAVSYYFELER